MTDRVFTELQSWEKTYSLRSPLEEDVVWRVDFAPHLNDLPHNVLEIWQYGFTEIMNNAIEHSSGGSVKVSLTRTTAHTTISTGDDGEGIFKKITQALNLLDERHAVLELAKGKLTTDPERHSGEGIFFCSRIFDKFSIVSGSLVFSHTNLEHEDWIVEQNSAHQGTSVHMTLDNQSRKSLSAVFDDFTSEEDYTFTKTVVPVRLAKYEDEGLVSRSQAKRLLMRIDKFKKVIFDFSHVDSIGQAFADEIFRVFVSRRPQIDVSYTNASPGVERMILRSKKMPDND